MKRYTKKIAVGLVIFLLILLVVLSLGFVEVPMNVMYSLFLSILFILALVVIPKAFGPRHRKNKR